MAASAFGQCNLLPRTPTVNPLQSHRQLYTLSFHRQSVNSSPPALSLTQSIGQYYFFVYRFWFDLIWFGFNFGNFFFFWIWLGFGSAIERQCVDRNGSDLFKTDAVRQLNGSVISAKGHRFAIVSFLFIFNLYSVWLLRLSKNIVSHLCRII